MPSIEDFSKFEFKIAQIKEVSDHPDADRLYVIKIDTGLKDESGGSILKQIVAGIKKSYLKEDLIGKYVVVVDNLDPAVLRGVESRGMLLAASDDDGIAIISPDRPVKLGAKVK